LAFVSFVSSLESELCCGHLSLNPVGSSGAFNTTVFRCDWAVSSLLCEKMILCTSVQTQWTPPMAAALLPTECLNNSDQPRNANIAKPSAEAHDENSKAPTHGGILLLTCLRLIHREAQLRQLFKKADKKNCGKLDAKELRTCLVQHDKTLDTNHVDDWIRKHDKNRDGRLNYEEFITFMLDVL
ncbi:calmodulin, partial [Clonorchis sinensis]